jgi:hypothetical protein
LFFFAILSGTQSVTQQVLARVLQGVFENVFANENEELAHRALTNFLHLLQAEKIGQPSAAPNPLRPGLMPNTSIRMALQGPDSLGEFHDQADAKWIVIRGLTSA